MPTAIEHVRRMRGGAQAHLMRCDDGYYYVVKFINNPQHVRILANEMLGTRVAARLGLPTAPAAVIRVTDDLIAYSSDLTVQMGNRVVPCRAGFQFGSRYPGDPRQTQAFDFLPEEQLGQVENLEDFAGMLVFDKWTCNTNGRQAIFLRESGQSQYRAVMIDQGFCFNAGEWSFPDGPVRGLYARHRVYASVRGMRSFEPWFKRVNEAIDSRFLDRVLSEVPPEWYEADSGALDQLMERLLARRRYVPDWILAAKNSDRQPFWNWSEP